MDGLSEISQIVGPLGVLVIVVIWSVVRVRSGNEKKADHSEAMMLMMQGLREDMRELRHELRQHFQDHAKI
jgi:uncharacterized membrane-anchored protein YhcB (DUF1043 family)